MAYIAVVLGFDARVETGALSRNGGKFASHGWTWIKIDKNWYIFDADVQTFYKRNCYMKSEKNYPFKLKHGNVYTASCENGVILWK